MVGKGVFKGFVDIPCATLVGKGITKGRGRICDARVTGKGRMMLSRGSCIKIPINSVIQLNGSCFRRRCDSIVIKGDTAVLVLEGCTKVCGVGTVRGTARGETIVKGITKAEGKASGVGKGCGFGKLKGCGVVVGPVSEKNCKLVPSPYRC